MRQAVSIRRNSFFAFLSQLIRLLTNVFLFVGIARYYGVDAFGQFTTAHSLSTIILLLADFGFDTLLPTEIARQRDRAAILAQQYFSLKLVLALGGTIIMFIVPIFKSFTPSTRILIQIFSFYVLFASLNSFFFALFKGLEEFNHETVISFYINSLLLLLLIVMGILHAPLYLIALSFVGTRIIGVVLALRIVSQKISFRLFQFTYHGWRNIWHRVAIFGLHFIFGNLFFQIDTILLAFWRDDREVGIYQSVFKIVGLALIIPDIAVNSLTPVLSRLYSEDHSQWIRLGRLLYKTLFLVSLPISLIMYIFAEQIITLVYGGNAFTEAIPILKIFAMTVFFRFGVDAYALMLTTSFRQSHRLVVVILGTIFNIVLNSIAIPTFGAIGAAVVSLITNVLVAAGYIIFSRISFVEWSLELRLLVIFLLTFVFCFLVWNSNIKVPLFFLPIVIVIYTIVIYFFGYSSRERRLLLSSRNV